MWSFSDDGALRTAVHTKGKAGFKLMCLGLLIIGLVILLHFYGAEMGIKGKYGGPFRPSVEQTMMMCIPGFVFVGIGFILLGVETRLTYDSGRNLFIYDYSYGFGSTHREYPYDQIEGLQFVRIYVDIVAKDGFRAGSVIGSRVDGALNLLAPLNEVVPLITTGDGAEVKEGSRQLSEFFGLDVHERSEKRVEYVSSRRKGIRI